MGQKLILTISTSQETYDYLLNSTAIGDLFIERSTGSLVSCREYADDSEEACEVENTVLLILSEFHDLSYDLEFEYKDCI